MMNAPEIECPTCQGEGHIGRDELCCEECGGDGWRAMNAEELAEAAEWQEMTRSEGEPPITLDEQHARAFAEHQETHRR